MAIFEMTLFKYHGALGIYFICCLAVSNAVLLLFYLKNRNFRIVKISYRVMFFYFIRTEIRSRLRTTLSYAQIAKLCTLYYWSSHLISPPFLHYCYIIPQRHSPPVFSYDFSKVRFAGHEIFSAKLIHR